MSFEGYYQMICEKGHYSTIGVHLDEPETFLCPACKEQIVWWNLVDTTNGSFYNGKRIDRLIKMEVDKRKVCDKCGSVLETTFKIPKKGGHRIRRKRCRI